MESTGYEGFINFIRNKDNRKVVELAKYIVDIANWTDEEAKECIDDHYSEFGNYMPGFIECEKIYDRIHNAIKKLNNI